MQFSDACGQGYKELWFPGGTHFNRSPLFKWSSMLAHVAGFLKQIHICFRPRDSERAVPWKCVKRPAAPDPWLGSCERAANRLQVCRSRHQKQQRSHCHFLRWNNVESRSITLSESRSAYPRSVAPTCRTCSVPTLCKLSGTHLFKQPLPSSLHV